MKVQKTSRGQPVMRNMIKYALTKIEENINKEKLQHLTKDNDKKNNNNHRNSDGNNRQSR